MSQFLQVEVLQLLRIGRQHIADQNGSEAMARRVHSSMAAADVRLHPTDEDIFDPRLLQPLC